LEKEEKGKDKKLLSGFKVITRHKTVGIRLAGW
jgi:hypothetical protein